MYAAYAKIRDQRGLTDYRVAKDTGIATTTLSSWKNGKYTPKLDKLQKIAVLLEVPIEALMQEQDKKEVG